MRFRPAPSAMVLGTALVIGAGLVATAPAPASSQAPPDSAALLEEARERQQAFELFRAERIPVHRDTTRTPCFQSIGRICIGFAGEAETDFPPEPAETDQARRGLIGVLLDIREQIRHPWVLGQLVHYLVEVGDHRLANRMATECGIEATWWCSALLGYEMHMRDETIGAEAAFRQSLAEMPAEERERWTGLRYVVPRDEAESLATLDPATRERRGDLFWRLSDPLFLVEGNDRLTEHFARLVVATNRRDAWNPMALEWEEDLEETLVRYGRNIGYSRVHSPGFSRPGQFRLRDTRRVVGHHHPRSRGYLFPQRFLESPSDIPPESWITAPRDSRAWHVPTYAPAFRGMETQVGRFRRAGEMLVVGAYRPVLASGVAGVEAPVAVENPFERIDGPVESALFLVPEDGGEAVRVDGSDAEGVFTVRTAPGRYVSSLEVFDEAGGRAWRARQGVRQTPLEPGLVDVSDLLILKEDAPLPASLDEAIPWVRPGVRVRGDETIAVVWEVYGLRVQEPVEVTIGFTRGRPGFLTRVGEFLGIVEPDRPVEVTFTDEGPDGVQSAFRAITMELPEVDPGEYTLHVRLELPGREPVVTSRPIFVEN